MLLLKTSTITKGVITSRLKRFSKTTRTSDATNKLLWNTNKRDIIALPSGKWTSSQPKCVTKIRTTTINWIPLQSTTS